MTSPPPSRPPRLDPNPVPIAAEDLSLERQSGVDLRVPETSHPRSSPRLEPHDLEPGARKPRPLRPEPLEPFRPPSTILSPPPGAAALASERAQTAALVERLLNAALDVPLEPLRWRSSRGTTVEVWTQRRADRLSLTLASGPGAEGDGARLAHAIRHALELRGIAPEALEIEQC